MGWLLLDMVILVRCQKLVLVSANQDYKGWLLLDMVVVVRRQKLVLVSANQDYRGWLFLDMVVVQLSTDGHLRLVIKIVRRRKVAVFIKDRY